MALTASGMRDKIKTALTALGIPTARFSTAMGTDGLTPDQILEAFCQGIINEIKANAVVAQPPDSNGDTESPGTIS